MLPIRSQLITLGAVALSALGTLAHDAVAGPITVNGDPFEHVASRPAGQLSQMFGLTSDSSGRVYIGNNSNNTSGVPVRVFDPALYSGTAITVASIGPAVGDADGIALLGGSLFVADRDEGVRRITLPGGADAVFIPGAAINGTGSPIVARPSDGHLFIGLGGLTGTTRIDEYDGAGAFVQSHTTGTDVETMTFDPATGRIYYAAFGSSVRVLDPTSGTDSLVATVSGTIDGGLAFDPITARLFVGTGNGSNPGLVEVINPATGLVQSFASGFQDSLGILREPTTGDLYFLERARLFRLPSSDVMIPEPGSAALFGLGLLVLAGRRRRSRRVRS